MVKQISTALIAKDDEKHDVPPEATHIGVSLTEAEFAFFASDQTGDFNYNGFRLTPVDTPEIMFRYVKDHSCGCLYRLRPPEKTSSRVQMVSC